MSGFGKKMRWVSCSLEVNMEVSKTRHILPEGSDTTLCGATGLGEGAWRGSRVKPACSECIKRGSALPVREAPQALLAEASTRKGRLAEAFNAVIVDRENMRRDLERVTAALAARDRALAAVEQVCADAEEFGDDLDIADVRLAASTSELGGGQ